MAHNFRVSGTFYDKMSSAYRNLPVEFSQAASIVLGSSSDEADSCVVVALSVANGGTQTVDLTSLTGSAGQTISLQEVHAIVCWTNNLGVALTDGGTNPFTGFGTDYEIAVSTAPFVWCKTTGQSCGGGNNTIDITNNAGATVTGTMIILGRD